MISRIRRRWIGVTLPLRKDGYGMHPLHGSISPPRLHTIPRFKSQTAAENGGLTTVGRFIFDKQRHAMRVIRSYNGAVPGPPTYEWHAFHQDEIDIENLCFAE